MKISVAMATFNGAKFLDEQLASLLSQTLLPYELVVRDDGSSDDTPRRLLDFKDRAPFPVKIIPTHDRLGFENNFLHVAEQCSGDFIALCDQDDIWLPKKLAMCASRLDYDQSVIALHTMTLIDENGRPFGHWSQDIYEDNVYEPLQLDPYLTGWGNAMVFARRLVHLVNNNMRPYQPEYPHRTMSHDTWIYTLAAALGRVSHIVAPLVLYRQHGANAAGANSWREPSVTDRALNVPIYRWKEQAKSAFLLADLFTSMDGVGTEAAANRYRARGELITDRVKIFTGSTFRARSAAWRRYYSASNPTLGMGSKAKAIMLGVLQGWRATQGRAQLGPSST